jgi:hypothetical protein
MVLIFALFGYQKWFAYEARTLNIHGRYLLGYLPDGHKRILSCLRPR